MIRVKWRGKPVWIVKRTDDMVYTWPTAPSTIRYSVRMDHQQEVLKHADAATSSDAYEHPFVSDRSALLMGSALFLMPAEWSHAIEVRFSAKPFGKLRNHLSKPGAGQSSTSSGFDRLRYFNDIELFSQQSDDWRDIRKRIK